MGQQVICALGRIAVVMGLMSGAAMAATAQDALTLDVNGRTLAARGQVRAGTSITIKVPALPFQLCKDIEGAVKLSLRYSFVPEMPQPTVISGGDRLEYDTAQGGFVIPATRADRYLVYNLYQSKVDDDAAVARCKADLKTQTSEHKTSKETLDKVTQTLETAETSVKALRQTLDSLRLDAAAYAGSGEAVDKIAEILRRIDETRRNLATAETQLAAAEAAVKDARTALTKGDKKAQSDLGGTIDEITQRIDIAGRGALLKVGGLTTGSSKMVFYDFATISPHTTLQMMPLGAYPPVRYGDRLFAVIANVQPETHPYRFLLAATSHDGVVVNTDPVRPVFDVTATRQLKEGARSPGPLPPNPVTATALVDVFLPVRGSFAPNQYAEVTITTERPDEKDPAKLAPITLVDKAQFPQFRALYRFNFNSGVFVSRLRDTEYIKVRTADDDPATKDVDESRYRTEALRADPSVRPAFAFTYYPMPVDIQSPVRWERLIPSPTIGFAFVNPQDNIFLGFSHEILRNAQVFWGWHWGVVKEAVIRNDVSENQDKTAPPTRERRKRAFSIGLTFNVAVIAQIFK